MSTRRRPLQIAAASVVLAGILLLNLVGFEGLWLPDADLSDVQLQRKYRTERKEWRELVRRDRARWIFFSSYTDIREARTHGWPFTWVYCGVWVSDGQGGYHQTTVWPFDGAGCLGYRIPKLVANIFVAVSMLWGTVMIAGLWRRKPHRGWFRFTTSTLLAAAAAVAVWLVVWTAPRPFAQSLFRDRIYVGLETPVMWCGYVWFAYALASSLLGMLRMGTMVFGVTRLKLAAPPEPAT